MLQEPHSLGEQRDRGSSRHRGKLHPEQLHLHPGVVHEHVCQSC